jgi:hypothetical protein
MCRDITTDVIIVLGSFVTGRFGWLAGIKNLWDVTTHLANNENTVAGKYEAQVLTIGRTRGGGRIQGGLKEARGK